MVPKREQIVAMLDWQTPHPAGGSWRALAYAAGIVAGAMLAVAVILGLFPGA